MPGNLTAELQGLIVRVREGDAAARKELINRAYPKLRALAAKLLGESFPRLKAQPALQDTSDVVNEVALRLYQALAEVEVATVLDFLRLAAWRLRLILLNEARKANLPVARDVPLDNLACPAPPPDSGSIPQAALWARLHERVERLPPDEREVVDLLFYHQLSEVEAAELLSVSARTVRRRWTSAKVRLFEALKDNVAGLDKLFQENQ